MELACSRPEKSKRPTALVLVLQASIASCLLQSCATSEPNLLRKRLDASIGQPFEQTPFNKPTAAIRTHLDGGPAVLQYRFNWNNGCEYVVSVNSSSGLVTGWRFTSPEALCEAVAHVPLGS